MLNIKEYPMYRDYFVDCCRAVLNNCSNPYAKAYAKAGLESPEIETREAMRVQCLYILSNTAGWRGPLAKATKAKLKELSKHGN